MIDQARIRRALAEHQAPEPEDPPSPEGADPEPDPSTTPTPTLRAALAQRGIHIHSRGL